MFEAIKHYNIKFLFRKVSYPPALEYLFTAKFQNFLISMNKRTGIINI